MLANNEAANWSVQWATTSPPDILEWPDEIDDLPAITVKEFRESLFSFAAGTGLGWDGLHPRAFLRLPDSANYSIAARSMENGRAMLGTLW